MWYVGKKFLAALRTRSASVFFAPVTVATIMVAVVFPSILHSLTTVKLRFKFPILIDSSVFPRLWGIILDLGAGHLFRAVHGSEQCTVHEQTDTYFLESPQSRFCGQSCLAFADFLFQPVARKKNKRFIFVAPWCSWQRSVPVCTLFSQLPQAQLLRLGSFFSGAPCALSGGHLPEALFMVFYWIPKVQKCAKMR